MKTQHNVFIAGATGYIGQRLSEQLLKRGHVVRGLVRPGSERRLVNGVRPVVGSALQSETFAGQIAPADTFVQLIGTPHPSPAKAREFREVDLASAKASVTAARQSGIRHFVYVSVAQPSRMMKAYQAVRAEAEALIGAHPWNISILRPWYVLGPGHWWPVLLLPGYWLAELFPPSRESARRLGLVTLGQMIATLVAAIENPPEGKRIWGVREIRSKGKLS